MMGIIRNIAFSALLVFLVSISLAFTGGASQGDRSADRSYAKNIFYDLKPVSPEMTAMMQQMREKSQSTVKGTRIVDLDTTRAQGAPYMDFVWLWKGSAKGYTEEEHYHNLDEVIGFIGSKGENDPRDLGGEMEVWLGGEKHLIKKSCLI